MAFLDLGGGGLEDGVFGAYFGLQWCVSEMGGLGIEEEGRTVDGRALRRSDDCSYHCAMSSKYGILVGWEGYGLQLVL